MAGKYIGRIPREGDRVTIPKTHGMYAVIKLDANAQKADIRLTNGTGPVVSDIPWKLLTFVDNKW
jgi:hypothetical protein